MPWDTPVNDDFMFRIVSGQIPGLSSVNKFGHNPLATTNAAIWSKAGQYSFFPKTAQIIDVVSSSSADTSGGTGARTIQVVGLDNNWLEVSEFVNLNGSSAVTLANEYIRMDEAIVVTAGDYETNAGSITLQIQGASTISSYIQVDDGQTKQAIYTIPANKQAYFVKGYVGVSDDDKNGETAEFQWLMRPNIIDDGAWQVKGQISLNTIGSSHWQYLYGIPTGPIPPRTDIKIVTIALTAAMGVVGGLDLILQDI